MMPTHGYGKFRSLLLGSVTAKALHDAKCAVWTAAHSEGPESTKHVACKSVMGAIELAPARSSRNWDDSGPTPTQSFERRHTRR